ncbi:serine/threonine protein kinase [Nitzschia inconspicua]|uniref:Serine/threonine protein kinase n=1 Tax=Nitzschia inconspicua TaxID=303405 RepID=A0A9K3KUX1_9STRA|nr:serine/threonine protein kinase [Nitzschia inconspicua]KAG7349911.1 serine/threonine protein kinase [Nitzschia inconspicua]
MSTSSHSKTRKTNTRVAPIPNSDSRFSNGISPSSNVCNNSDGEDQDHDNQQQQQSQDAIQKNSSSARASRSGRKSTRTTVLDDDDFSVAPSMDQDVKSVVSVGFDDVYKRGRKLGLGAFAVVFIGTHRPTGAEYAVKQIDRSTMYWGDRDALQDEIANLKLAREGPNIVQLYEVYEERAFCYLVMELMEGGELLELIIEKKTFLEHEARSSIKCVLQALAYMHEKRVAHRDIKPENLLLSDHKDLNSIKLADFSFAKYVRKRNDCRTLCGTPGYLAPEMLERFPAYDVKCDVWSVGCLIFLLLSGCLPFDDEDDEVVFDLTRNGQFDFHPQDWASISRGAKDLISHMLIVNPKKRISAAKALESNWVEKGDPELEKRQMEEVKQRNLTAGKQKLQQAMKNVMAANRVKLLNDTFAEYLEKRKEENTENRIVKKDRRNREEFVEDSLSGLPFEDFYEIGDELGEGGYAFVYRCFHKRTKKVYAVKEVVISKMESGGESTLKDEITALRMLRGGPHIVRLYDVFYEEDHCFMVMEEMRGGDLLSRIVDKEVYTEREARGVCKILFEAVLYCHQKRVAHRDIKPENLLLVDGNDDTTIKLADFGFAKRVKSELSLSTLCGTAQYVAPEILDFQVEGYDERCDMWSVGVVVYILLGGYAPFEGPPDELAQFIIRGDYEFHEKYWADISESAKDMIHGMLQVDPNYRLSATDALSCEWMGLAPEELASKDLGGARAQMERTALSSTDNNDAKKALQALVKTNKFLSLGNMTGDQAQVSDPEKLGVEEAAEYDFEDCYDWGRQIGIGTFSVIHECVNSDDGQKYAVKRIPRVDLWEEDAVALQSEISCLKEVSGCDYIVRLKEVFDEPDFTFIVEEYLRGGYLIDRVIEKEYYDEPEGLIVAKRLIMAVEYCHCRRIAIRDLKPDTMLLVGDSETEVKLTDFGYAKKVLQPNSLTTVCGTEKFVAPEIIEHIPRYDVECDIWSLGVVIFLVLGGYIPFRGEGEECLERIRYGKYTFHQKFWGHVSHNAKVLISRMLTVDVSRRITATEALESDWIRSCPDEKRRKKSKSTSGKGNDKRSR